MLLGIICVAAALRVRGLAFGLPALYDPDEPIFVLSALKLLAGRTLNPGWFGHPGTTTIYALALVDVGVIAVGILTGRFADTAAFARAFYADPGIAFLPGRVVMVVCGLACVGLTFLIGKRLFSPGTGLLAALLLALDPIHIKYSQIIRTDMMATVFILLCVLSSIAIVRRGAWRDYVWAAIWLGFAVATKWPAVAVAASIGVAGMYRALQAQEQRKAHLLRLIAVAPMAFAALLVASPYLLLDFATLVRDLHGEARPHHLGSNGYGFLGNIAWYVSHPLRQALSSVGLALAVFGLVLAGRANRLFLVTVVPALATFLLAISAQALIWERWAVPLLPLVTIAAAMAMVAIGRWIGGRAGSAVVAALTLAVLVPTAIAGEAAATERANDTRAQASRWFIAHVGPGNTVVVEQLAFDLLNHGYRFLFPVGDAGCVDVAANLKSKIPYARIQRWRGGRPVLNIATINPRTFASCRANYAIIVDYDRYLNEAPLYPVEIAAYRRFIAQGRIVATFRPQAGRVGGLTVRIVQLDPNASGWSATPKGV